MYRVFSLEIIKSLYRMKKSVFIYALVTIVSFCIGYFTCQKCECEKEDYKFLIEANNFKRELIDAQYKALNQANIIMDDNKLWYSSDDMLNYMEYVETVDSLYESLL